VGLTLLRVARFRHDQDKFDIGKFPQRTAKVTWDMAIGWTPPHMLSCNARTCGLKALARVVCGLKYFSQFSARALFVHMFTSRFPSSQETLWAEG
jgi:hypothetical protein